MARIRRGGKFTVPTARSLPLFRKLSPRNFFATPAHSSALTSPCVSTARRFAAARTSILHHFSSFHPDATSARLSPRRFPPTFASPVALSPRCRLPPRNFFAAPVHGSPCRRSASVPYAQVYHPQEPAPRTDFSKFRPAHPDCLNLNFCPGFYRRNVGPAENRASFRRRGRAFFAPPRLAAVP